MRNAEVFHFAQKSWNYLFAAGSDRFSADHSAAEPASGIDQPRIDQRACKHLPHRVQIEIDLCLMFGTLSSGLEFKHRETARSGLDETIDGSTKDSSVDRHRERHLVQRSARRVQHAHILSRADRRICVHRGVDEGVHVVAFLDLVVAQKARCTLRRRVGCGELANAGALQEAMHQRTYEAV
jgi:hypothetical protein